MRSIANNNEIIMKKLVTAIAILIVVGMVVSIPVTEEAYAKKPDNKPDKSDNKPDKEPNAKVRAIQDGKSLGMNPGEEGLLGTEIWCVGGIDNISNANDIHCYLLPDNVPTPQYKTDPSVIKRDGDSTNIAPCPTGVGFQPSDICFWVSFPAEDFQTIGHYRFVAEFTKDGNIIDLAGINYRVHSFMVLPEVIVGSIGIVGSALATLYVYKRKIKE